MKSGSSWLNAVQLNPLDFAEIDYLDPALKDGHKVLYDRILNINIRFQDRFSEVQELSQPEPIRLRVLQLVTIFNPQSIKIEISSEKDLFFLFHHEATVNGFTQIKALQNLQMPFKDYAQITIIRSNKIIMDVIRYGAIFQVMLDGSARLEINQTTEFRSVHMIHFDFHQVEESFLRQTIVFKYNQQRKEIKYLTQSLNECRMRATGTFK
ncbi:unnamed protein product (macronuclear) [Paramecium tetraurelia]|uniref:Spindle assembly abnormal protein 6 N-terminal domain-containing protein n=1 Tax=Paramecium tetraurelia TaxID=5888 RepID=A0DMG0_PARTE|nr:uncharacterized protein GSPATT00018445001 [Paramecium tetraurelia]CAK84227.1 unnamed protein product [Paramecium tetraurelia]|eukprot:XP_001451624.1 hypothetical protein (macronuclear) [Paramecium tetraurelia strain d4-2]